ncbi:hypothetical protein EDD16DRAFT_431087 [Pisolithus croceorrhizus]|nr:hypothetical protein EDD16DRAFT_431087 [Pisolithus croceorrhizus]KAI6130576.1 hypothetical protein EV401DRAFT_586495 [Pisolithus croceorrhizus]KAI6161818.1 hypothetical protein EDD17DRAFT_647349 [Pisolithus thermaeus]
MSTTSHPRRNDSPSPPLQRGRACISCRRRKMRCDGLRPTCTQCLRGDRAIDCEYTDGTQRPRTLVLEEDIARLQARIRELEDPQTSTPSVTLQNPYGQTPQPTMAHQSPSIDITQRGADNDFDSVSDLQYLIDTLVPYAFDLGIFLSLPRLRAQPRSITPALRSALILSSFHLTRSSATEQAVSIEALISRLLHTLADAVVVANPRLGPQFYMHILQAEVLLAYHLLHMGRISIAQSHANAAMSLAVCLGLHMRSGDAPAGGSFDFLVNFLPRLPLPSDAIEEQERVDAWWTIHSLVKFTETICVGPPVVSSTTSITTSWPGTMRDSDVASSGATRDTVSQFLLAQDFGMEGETLFGLQARVSALLGEAHSMTAAYHRYPPISQSADFRSRFTTLDNLIQKFFSGLPHPATLSRSPGTGGAYASRQMLLIVNLAALAQITLHRPFASLHAPSNRRCVDSAIRAVQALNGLEDPKIMNPICVVSWGVFFSTLEGELRSLRSRAQLGYGSVPAAQGANEVSEADVVNALRSLVSFSGSWSSQYPLQMTIRAKLHAAASSI